MKRGIKKKDYENLGDENVRKVIALLEPKDGKPITKKEACEILNISYNTSRLSKIMEGFVEKQEYVAKRKKMNRGKPASDVEISEAVVAYLQGEPVADISRALYRSPHFINDIINNVGVPQRVTGAEDKSVFDTVPDACISEVFEPGEIVWSAKYHTTAVVGNELSLEYQETKGGLGKCNYEDRYSSKCYEIYVIEVVDSAGSLFPNVESGGFNAYSLAYDLAKLSHLTQYGVDLGKI
jgi:hypothetical protein